MKEINLKDLLEAGCHFGHESRRWHPKAAAYIYGVRNGVHIIDLAKTKEGLERACEIVDKLGREGKVLLFVGTKRQSSQIIKNEAERVGAAFFNKRWVGGFITNWIEIKKTLDKLNKMEEDKKLGNWQQFPKHEQLKLDRERMKLEKFYGGVKMLKNLPDALFIADIKNEKTAVTECISGGVTTIAISDTNTDPSRVTYAIPANDDGVKSITLIVKIIADSYERGKQAASKGAKAEAVQTKVGVSVAPQQTGTSAVKKVVAKPKKEAKSKKETAKKAPPKKAAKK